MQRTTKDISILVIDDSEVAQRHVISTCQKAGAVNFQTAFNGVEALEMIKQADFDLLFVDIEMPEMDGIDFVRAAARIKPNQSVIILSSKEPTLILSVGSLAELDGLRVLGTFRKPLELEQLCNSLNMLLQVEWVDEKEVKESTLTHEDVQTAIREKQIYLAYQPKVTASGLHLKGVEALARWNHPERGYVSPIEFISVAEKQDLITELTLFLYEKALHQKRTWAKLGLNIHLAFNLSPLSLKDQELIDKIIGLAEEHEIQPCDIVLEVTENALAKEVSDAIASLAHLRMKGFKIAIDDFGTGYANNQQLSRVPATELKLDRSLITNVSNKPQQQTILENTLSLAKELDLKVVAEGVEYENDFKLIQQSDVDLIQGYIVSPPLDNDSFMRWVRKDLNVMRNFLMQKIAI